jgi:hypothetical protein
MLECFFLMQCTDFYYICIRDEERERERWRKNDMSEFTSDSQTVRLARLLDGFVSACHTGRKIRLSSRTRV